MKALKGKTLMSLIYAMCLSIPLVSILSRVIYVQTNKNAYQSYYGETINEETYTNINDVSNLSTNSNYIFSNSNLSTNLGAYIGNQNNGLLLNIRNIITNQTGFDLSNCDKITYLTNADGTKVATRFYNGNTLIGYSYDNYRIEADYIGNDLTTNDITAYNTILNNGTFIDLITYNKYSYLDNVFDYSVNQLVSENNFGQLNFFSWFGNMLLTDSQQNMLFVRFVNWYLNYALLVSLMQILFLCLMWFVNFSRKLLDRGMNYDW